MTVNWTALATVAAFGLSLAIALLIGDMASALGSADHTTLASLR